MSPLHPPPLEVETLARLLNQRRSVQGPIIHTPLIWSSILTDYVSSGGNVEIEILNLQSAAGRNVKYTFSCSFK